MADRNEVILEGVFSGRRPLGEKGCSFMVKTEKRDRGQTFTSSIPVVAFGPQSDAAYKLADGDRVEVRGELRRRKYNEKWETQIVASRVDTAAPF